MTYVARIAEPKVHFGGPDQEPRALRDHLAQRIDAVPPGGSIDWITYYFRDERLAETLVRAHRRGVSVRICLDGKPRHHRINDRVIEILSGPEGIGDGLHVVRHLLPSHLHAKLYCFSHPRPAALVGSFNPSGNLPEDAEILGKIGDQDRGHNLLVEIDDPPLVKAFLDRVAAIHSASNPFGRRRAAQVRGKEVYFFPRLGRNPIDERLKRLGTGSALRIAVSHFGDFRIARNLGRRAARGAKVEVLTHHSQRRSPEEVVKYLRGHGVRTYRYEHPAGLPMHAKFILAESPDDRWSAIGSYNLNWNSRWINQELLLFSDDPQMWHALDQRWATIISEPWCQD